MCRSECLEWDDWDMTIDALLEIGENVVEWTGAYGQPVLWGLWCYETEEERKARIAEGCDIIA